MNYGRFANARLLALLRCKSKPREEEKRGEMCRCHVTKTGVVGLRRREDMDHCDRPTERLVSWEGVCWRTVSSSHTLWRLVVRALVSGNHNKLKSFLCASERVRRLSVDLLCMHVYSIWTKASGFPVSFGPSVGCSPLSSTFVGFACWRLLLVPSVIVLVLLMLLRALRTFRQGGSVFLLLGELEC